MTDLFSFSKQQLFDVLDIKFRQPTSLARIDIEKELTDVETRIKE